MQKKESLGSSFSLERTAADFYPATTACELFTTSELSTVHPRQQCHLSFCEYWLSIRSENPKNSDSVTRCLVQSIFYNLQGPSFRATLLGFCLSQLCPRQRAKSAQSQSSRKKYKIVENPKIEVMYDKVVPQWKMQAILRFAGRIQNYF